MYRKETCHRRHCTSKGEDIAKLNTVDALGALQSQSPGVNITQNNGFLGSGFKVNIRGIGTTGTFSPLYVVDGVANGSIDGLNPSDIESLDVLKDAASAAIYGARAANGVILITTKRGKPALPKSVTTAMSACRTFTKSLLSSMPKST